MSKPPLSPGDLRFWEENGYVVVREVVPIENCRAAEKAVWEFAGMDPDDPETWYPDPPVGIMKEIYQHQALWAQSPAPAHARGFQPDLGDPQAEGES